MYSNMQQLGIDAWSADDRLRLLGEIWDSLDPPDEIPEHHREEIDRRIAAAEAYPEEAIPWKEALARLNTKP
jgi:putative addiction module component (TIGR02574 family)